MPKSTGDVGEMLSVNVVVVNEGNAHATDVNIILNDQTNRTSRRTDAMRTMSFTDRCRGDNACEDPPKHRNCYVEESKPEDMMLCCRNPDNVIVESNEDNNMQKVSGKMGSNLERSM